MKRQENLLKNQKGFTLIEIIAVLVILGILSAVAVPKYMDLQNQSRIKAADAAIAEVKSRLSNGFGIYLLKSGGALPNTVALVCGANGINDANVLPLNAVGTVPNLGDYTATIAANGLITVTAVQGTALSPARTNTWTLPN
ncbi:MAG: prepilin-type N-terminal cleavage/methylation domain-containing protein [Deltaproteobacteria bacterium]|uniref:type II secretion system protein n=1 Tax=Desulfobacula sp. TaxID=2593537 RepID=UPI0019B5E885|nr:prepilin-type N-terminal cleavage/methylation domain-containing protein [Candidatus Desulfobacula maris]MBL6994100.1 prepilin-type N-terminal cleavage/methylation domain-containing protein [Desulfobacula sp.]